MSAIPKDNRAFLDVEKSLSGKRWVERLDGIARNQALKISQTTNIPDLIARVLAARGVDADSAEQFLTPTIKELMPDPSVLTDMDKAAARICEAIDKHQRIAIFGDYDVDGASASALLSRFLNGLSIPNEIYIPDRIFEGYGPNPEAITQLIERGADLIVTVDCGVTSFEALVAAKKLETDVIVLDHHQMGTEMPPALALVNPNRQDDLSGLGYLCAAGVVFITLVAVQRELRKRNKDTGPSLLDMLDIVALATVCDVVPLKGLNRAFVVKGMQVFRQQKNIGLQALSKAARLDGPITPYHLGFLLGPRINAGGRIGDAALGSRLLVSQSIDDANAVALQLDDLNKERQAAEAIMLEEAIAEGDAEMGEGEGPTVLVTARQGWHPGIVGLLASRLKDRFNRPALAIAFDGNGKGSGSGRSIAGVDLGAAIRAGVEAGVLEKGGGHVMAAGLTVQKPKLGELRAFLEEQLAGQVARSTDHLSIKVDGALTARSASIDFCDLLERAGPYGAGHSQPIFAFPNHLVKNSRIVGRDHVSFTLQSSDGKTLRAIAFKKAEEPLGQALLEGQGKYFHLCGMITVDTWQGSKRVQLRLLDAARA